MSRENTDILHIGLKARKYSYNLKASGMSPFGGVGIVT